MYQVADLADAIDEYSRIVQEYHDGHDVDEDDTAEAKQRIVEIVHYIYFDDGEFNETAYEMHAPNGALILVEGRAVYVEIDSDVREGETEKFRIPPPARH